MFRTIAQVSVKMFPATKIAVQKLEDVALKPAMRGDAPPQSLRQLTSNARKRRIKAVDALASLEVPEASHDG